MSRLREQDAQRRRQSGAGPEFSEALARGLQIMSAFDATRPQMSISDLSRHVDLPRATVRRSLLTLVELGYAEIEGRMFRLLPRTLELASAFLSSSPVATVYQPSCERLSRETTETCMLAAIGQDEVVTIAFAVPPQTMPGGTGVGYRLPIYCTALGRVLMASRSDDEIDAYLARARLEPLTEWTQTDPAAIRAEIMRVRQDGYCLMDQQAEYGYRSIAVPVRRFDGQVVAALNVGGRAGRITPEQMIEKFLPRLLDETRQLRPRLLF